MSDKISDITGTITLTDGTTSTFTITRDAGWFQGGADTARLGRTVEALEAMAYKLAEEDLIVTSDDEDDEDEGTEACPFCATGRVSAAAGEEMCADCVTAGHAEADAEELHPTALASVSTYVDDHGMVKPVIIESPEHHPFAPGERETDYRPATVAEVAQYRADYADGDTAR